MRLRFIGQNGSMGLAFGRIYRLSLNPSQNGIMVTAPIRCPYESEDAFWRNWCHPDVDLRIVMERRGRDLRELHLPKENNNAVHDDLVPARPAPSGADQPDSGSVVHAGLIPASEARRILGGPNSDR